MGRSKKLDQPPPPVVPEGKADAGRRLHLPAGLTSPAGRLRLPSRGRSSPIAESVLEPSVEVAGASPLLAGILSFVWPGLGQLYARRRTAALVFAVPAAVLAAWLVLLLAQGLALFAGSFADSSFALLFALAVVFAAVWRGASILHAYGVAAPRKRPRVLDLAVMGVLLLAILATHGFVARLSWAAFQFDQDVAGNDFLGALPTQSADPNEQYEEPTPPPFGAAGTYAAPRPTWTITPAPITNRITVLLAGVDYTTGRSHALMDSLMVVSLNTATGKVSMVSVPRDTANYEFYWGGTAGVNTKINNFYNLVRSGLIHAPDAPLTALKKEIGWLVGVRVDYYAIVDLHTFRVLADMIITRLGSLCVTNPRAINDPSTGTVIPKGYYCFKDGMDALKYVRSREGAGDSDYSRAARQQDVLVAMEQKLATPQGLLMLPDVLGLVGQSIQSDFPLRTVKNYIRIAQGVDPNHDVYKCVLGPPYNYHPPTTQTRGTWTTRLKPFQVATASTYLFGSDSRFYGMEGILPQPCPHS